MKKKLLPTGAWLVLLWSMSVILPGCIKNELTSLEKRIIEDDEAIRAYLKNNNVQANPQALGSYTYYSQALINNPAGRSVKANDIITIYYKVFTLNGIAIDSLNAINGVPLKLELRSSVGALFPVGLDAGLSEMRQGEKYRFFIPSSLAFSDYEYSNVLPSFSNLIIEAEIVDIISSTQQKNEEEQIIKKFLVDHNYTNVDSLGNGLYYIRTQEGEGSLPLSNQSVKVKYVGRFLDSSIFDESGNTNFEFLLDKPSIIPGFRMGVSRMKKGEKGKLIIPSHLAYGGSRQVVPGRIREDMIKKKLLINIPPYTPITFDIEMVSF
jgi:FKBP-type peptidyl-prolyl cis-trans isomerase